MPPTEYEAWSEFRYEIRVWMRLSEEAARDAGIPPQHHQLLLAIAGFTAAPSPLIADLADRMQLRHHTVVGLLDRMEERGLVERVPIGRGVEVHITPVGEAALAQISAQLRPDLRQAAERLLSALTTLLHAQPRSLRPASRGPSGRRRSRVHTERAHT